MVQIPVYCILQHSFHQPTFKPLLSNYNEQLTMHVTAINFTFGFGLHCLQIEICKSVEEAEGVRECLVTITVSLKKKTPNVNISPHTCTGVKLCNRTV